MDQPEVQKGDCIWVGEKMACVLRILNNGDVYVGYFQYEGRRPKEKPWKPIGEIVDWDGTGWIFRAKGPDGAYLHDGREIRMIRNCYER